MAAPDDPPRSTLGLVVLGLLLAQPMHVYGMQKLIGTFGKDRVVNIRSRATLYATVQRLVRLGLVQGKATVPTEGWPDRKVYEITDAGTQAADRWLREMLHTPADDYPEFIAAVSQIFFLTPDDARAELELRAQQLSEQLAEV